MMSTDARESLSSRVALWSDVERNGGDLDITIYILAVIEKLQIPVLHPSVSVEEHRANRIRAVLLYLISAWTTVAIGIFSPRATLMECIISTVTCLFTVYPWLLFNFQFHDRRSRFYNGENNEPYDEWHWRNRGLHLKDTLERHASLGLLSAGLRSMFAVIATLGSRFYFLGHL